MKKVFLILLVLVFAACGKKKDEGLGLDYKWDDVVKGSKGTKVNIYMWGGSTEVNKFMDNIIAKNLKEENDIYLNRVPITDIKDTVNKLIVEKQAGKKDGSVDVIWINGENFKLLKESGVLWGDFVKNLPAKEKVKDATLVSDFGESVDGLEAPWGEAQFNFIYHSSQGEVPFRGYEGLKNYVEANPGVFTYPSIPDFTGSAFVRNMVIDILGEERAQEMSSEEFREALEDVWSYLNEIKPYLWRNGETYPESQGKLDTLYRNGEVEVTMGYTINKVASKIATGEFTEDSKSFLLDRGTLFNNHYLSIPANSKNKAGAVYVVNYLLSEEAQLAKQDPQNWGDSTILDMNKLSSEDREAFERVGQSDAIPSLEEMGQKRVRELSPEKLEIIEEGWMEYVGKN
ncbi:ABC transporter substrate-binding protein [Propionigenium maris DSM 9537]|uniref:ABC transporter substrate-binding protein n=1 Tax=Propionigenium maris DSM 9537 TaxID=1123000 RepID=A0A9W6GJY3_9FUSO|nr:ABC transporter substrate-binding protein [Propionigenium maris]GLI55131.1 ABC transporter substrate-binding protein [Propionigenium maris DSM 9537]